MFPFGVHGVLVALEVPHFGDDTIWTKPVGTEHGESLFARLSPHFDDDACTRQLVVHGVLVALAVPHVDDDACTRQLVVHGVLVALAVPHFDDDTLTKQPVVHGTLHIGSLFA
jgi:hypothetical protein